MPWWAGGRHNPALLRTCLTPACLPLQHISDQTPTAPAEFVYDCVEEDELVSGPAPWISLGSPAASLTPRKQMLY